LHKNEKNNLHNCFYSHQRLRSIYNTRCRISSKTKIRLPNCIYSRNIISNFINSLKDKDIENYLSSLSDSSFTDKIFSFSPSSEALSQFPALGDNWSKKNESQYLNNLKIKIPDELPITLTLSNPSQSVHGDSITYVASYSLNVPLNETTIPSNYQGELIFELVRDSRFVWSIYFWRDIKRSDSPSWSELKGRFY